MAAWLLLSVLCVAWQFNATLNGLQHGFETDSRIAHRLLTQRTVQHETILATLAAGAADDDMTCAATARKQITVMYPQVEAVWCSTMGGAWTDTLALAERTSEQLKRAVVTDVDLANGHYSLVLAGRHQSWALRIDVRKMIPRTEWPASSLHIELRGGRQHLVVQQDERRNTGWQFDFSKPLSSESQPFSLLIRQRVGWGDLPWRTALLVMLGLAAALAACAALRLQWVGRHRAERLLRLRKVERLNTLGELAAGLAHELNQPLTAILANCQAAKRLLNEDDADLGIARDALNHAVGQAKRAAQVIAHLRNAIGEPNQAGNNRPVSLNDAVNSVLHLLAPEFRTRQATLLQAPSAQPVMVDADPVALDQILHNLLMNALQALELVPVGERTVRIGIERSQAGGRLTIADSGPGIAPAALPRLFEPFFTTRSNGLGLGLSLCETLAGSMGGAISAANRQPRGAEFVLSLPHSS
ncbi:MAG: sensor histidine kinase [Noviherbaspirillum sp.]